MKPTALSMALALAMAITAALAEAPAGTTVPPLTNEPASEKTSYETRNLKRRDVHDMDPNVYVYSRDFARRFQMPEQWISDDLKGAEAVAFRAVAGYRSCGWGGNPEACRNDEVRCEMDVYFDHRKQPLPWDERMPASKIDDVGLSAHFLWSPVSPRVRALRPNDNPFTRSSPFIDPKTGKGLGWQEWYVGNSVGGWGVTVRSYDREIFSGIGLVVFGVSCNGSRRELWLTSSGLSKSDASISQALAHSVVFPTDWQTRVKEMLTETEQRNNAFFKEQGEKALKALRESPVPNKPLVPLQ